MEPEGNLVDILEYRKGVDFYSSTYKQSSGRKFESEKLREDIREELHNYSIPALGSNNPARDNAAALGEVFFYYLPEFDSSSLVSSKSTTGPGRTMRLTADRATTLAYWYVEAVHNEWDQCQPVEEELIERFLRYLRFKIKQRVYEKAKSDNLQKIPSLDENFEIQKRAYQSLEDLERRTRELEDELDELEEEYDEVQEQLEQSEENSSLLTRLFSPFNRNKLQQKAVDLKKTLHRKRKEMKTLRNILNVPKEFPALRKWVRERKSRFEAAKNRNEFERTVEKIQEQREKQQGLTALQPGEFRNMLEGAMEGIAVAAPGGEAEEGEEQPSRPTFPPYLELKNNYEQEDIQRIFQAINNDELDLGDEVSRIRSMLLTGDARGAIKEIRSIIKRRHNEQS